MNIRRMKSQSSQKVRLAFGFCAVILVIAAALWLRHSRQIPAPPSEAVHITPSSTTAVPLSSFTQEDRERVEFNAKGGMLPQLIGRSFEWSLPAGVDAAQFRTAYRLKFNVLFGVVQQGNTGLMFTNEDGSLYQGPASFVGLIASFDEGDTWKVSLPLPTSTLQAGESPVRLNVVGLGFDEKRQGYVADVADDRGAGSGEGILMRFFSRDAQTWTRDAACYYLLPERYYTSDSYPHEPATTTSETQPTIGELKRPFELRTTDCPTYVQGLDHLQAT